MGLTLHVIKVLQTPCCPSLISHGPLVLPPPPPAPVKTHINPWITDKNNSEGYMFLLRMFPTDFLINPFNADRLYTSKSDL